MQLTVDRQKLIDQLNRNITEIEAAAQAEQYRLDGLKAELHVHANALADYFETLARGLRSGVFYEGEGASGIVGATTAGGDRHELPTRPKSKTTDKRTWIERAENAVTNRLQAAIKTRRAALAVLELGVEDVV